MIFYALLSPDKTFLSLNEVGTTMPSSMEGIGVIPISDNLNLLEKGKLLKERCSSALGIDITKVNRIRVFTRLSCSKYVGVNA